MVMTIVLWFWLFWGGYIDNHHIMFITSYPYGIIKTKESSEKRGIYCRKGRQRAHCQESPLHRTILRDKKNSVHIDSQRTQTLPTAAQASQIAKKKIFFISNLYIKNFYNAIA